MLADIGTKALGEKQFVYLRDLANRYALVRASNECADLPALVVSISELKIKMCKLLYEIERLLE